MTKFDPSYFSNLKRIDRNWRPAFSNVSLIEKINILHKGSTEISLDKGLRTIGDT